MVGETKKNINKDEMINKATMSKVELRKQNRIE